MSPLPPPSIPPLRNPSRPSSRTFALVGGTFLAGLAILRVCYRVAQRREPCEVVDPVLGVIRDATCRVGERFHTVLAPWFLVLSATIALVLLTILLLVPLIARRIEPDPPAATP